MKLLEPFLKEIYWAQIWSIHFASQLKQRRTFNELLTLTVAVGERYREVTTTQGALLSILQKEPHGIKVISA